MAFWDFDLPVLSGKGPWDMIPDVAGGVLSPLGSLNPFGGGGGGGGGPTTGPNAPYEQERIRYTEADQAMREQQRNLAQMLSEQAQGKGPSVAQTQLQQGRNAAMANAMAMQASARGGNPALAARTAQQQQAQIAQGAAGQAAQLRAQEMLAGRGLYAQQLAGMRGQELEGQKLIQQQQQVMSGMASQADIAEQERKQARESGLIQAGGALLGGAMVASDIYAKDGRRPLTEEERRRMIEQLRQQMGSPGRAPYEPGANMWQGMAPTRGEVTPDEETMARLRRRLPPEQMARMLMERERLGGGLSAEQDERIDRSRARVLGAPDIDEMAPPMRAGVPTARYPDWNRGITTERYDYRPEYGGRPSMGPNAQALQRSPSPEVRSVVDVDPRTGLRRIDGGRAGAVALGVAADQQRKIDMLSQQLEEMQIGSREGETDRERMMRELTEGARRSGVPRYYGGGTY